jgi:hypothetical protein
MIHLLGKTSKPAVSGSLYDLQLPRSGAPDNERHLCTCIATLGKMRLMNGNSRRADATGGRRRHGPEYWQDER